MVVRASLPKRLSSARLALNDLAGELYSITIETRNWLKQLIHELDALYSASSNAVARAIRSATGIVDVSAATAPTSGQVLTATSATTATWQTAPQPSELWSTPATAGALDDEFTGTTLNAKWLVYSGAGLVTPGTTVDPYTSFAAGNPKIQVGRAAWQSWVQIQTPSNAATISMVQATTLPTNIFIWARIGVQRRATVNANASRAQLMLVADTAGSPDFNNRIQLGYAPGAGTPTIDFASVAAGVGTTVATGGAMGLAQGVIFEYFGIQKIGTTYHGWCFTENRGFAYMGSAVNTFTAAYAGFLLLEENIATTIPGNTMHNIDFFRSVAAGNYLP